MKYRAWLCRSGVGLGVLCFQVEPVVLLVTPEQQGPKRKPWQSPHAPLPLDMYDVGLLPSEGLHGDRHTLPLTPTDWVSGADGH